jgi:dephospho-CoA kinase
MIICVIGRARSGKTTASNILSEITGIPTASTSDIVYNIMALASGCTVSELKSMPKEILRPQLIDIANYLCDIDPSILSKGLVQKGYKIVDGIRRETELLDLKKTYENEILITLIKSNRSINDNFNIPDHYADIIIDNNGTMEELKKKLTDIKWKI